MKRRFALNAVLLAAVVVLSALAVSIAVAQEGDIGKRLDRISKKAKLRDYDALWELSKEIIDIGEDAADTLLEKLPNAGEKERLVYDAALYELREAGAATEDLMSLVGNDKADLTARLLAVDLIESKGMRTDVRKLFGNRAKYTEPLLRIADQFGLSQQVVGFARLPAALGVAARAVLATPDHQAAVVGQGLDSGVGDDRAGAEHQHR